MNEEYLWNKTGDDPEIEKLESLLGVLRYQETAMLTRPVGEVLPFLEKPSTRWFSFRVGFAACAAILILLSIWFQISRVNVDADENLVTVSPQIGGEIQVDSPVPSLRVEEVGNTRPNFRYNLKPPRQSAILVVRRKTVAVRSDASKTRPIKLTHEEKYAYGQLMLALSVTGSKLKIVQDKINGIEDLQNTGNER